MSQVAARIQIRVRYAETDGQRVAHHAVYFVWFELARAEILRQCGVDYRELEGSGLFFVVVEASIRYRSPARYDDLITVTVELSRLRTRDVIFRYDVSIQNKSLSTGQTRLILVNREGRPVSIPDKLREQLRLMPPDSLGDAIIGPCC